MNASAIIQFFNGANKNIFKIAFGGIDITFRNFLIKDVEAWVTVRENELFENTQYTNGVIAMLENLNRKYIHLPNGVVTIKIVDWKISNCTIKTIYRNN